MKKILVKYWDDVLILIMFIACMIVLGVDTTSVDTVATVMLIVCWTITGFIRGMSFYRKIRRK